MKYPNFDSLLNASWYSYSDEPIQNSPLLKPRISNPVVVLPEDSPDRLWHLFADSWFGIEHFVSTSGFNYQKKKLVVFRAHNPFIYKENDIYYLIYETHDIDYKIKNRSKNRSSRICIKSSTDLKLWSKAKVILDSKDVPFSSNFSTPRLSRPQLLNIEGMYRLYFGASEKFIYDTKQKATCYFSAALCTELDGKYKTFDTPLLETLPDSKYQNLALGAMKIINLSDGIAAINTSHYFDKEKNKSRSIARLLFSQDGINFEEKKIIFTSPNEGWASRCLTFFDIAYKKNENTWYCFFSANGEVEKKSLVKVRENIGLLIAKGS